MGGSLSALLRVGLNKCVRNIHGVEVLYTTAEFRQHAKLCVSSHKMAGLCYCQVH